MRSWDINQIINSDLSEYEKNIILNELSHQIANDDPSNYNARNNDIKTFKIKYFHYLRYLKKMLGPYYIKNLHKKYSLSEIGEYTFQKEDNIDAEILLANIQDFFETLEDPEIINKIKEIINPDKHYLHIEDYDDNNPICKVVKGRCIKTNTHTFTSYYLTHTAEDMSILTHEIGHTLNHLLFKDKINFIMTSFLSETESYYFELLMNNYIANYLHSAEIATCLEANRIEKIVNIIWQEYTQKILFLYPSKKPNFDIINLILKLSGGDIKLTDTTAHNLIQRTIIEQEHLLHSFLIALNLYVETLKDKEKGIYYYKKIMTSENSDIKGLYKNNSIDYDKILSYFDTLYNKAKKLKLFYDK